MLDYDMNRKITLMLVALVALDILDGDFNDISVLDAVKGVLYIVCFALVILNNRKNKEDN